MMRPRSKSGAWLLLMVAACAGGTETGNPPGVAEAGLSLVTSDPMVASTEPDGGGVHVQQARLSVGELTLLPCASDAVELAILQAPQVIDLATDQSSPLAFETGEDEYCGLRISLLAAPADAPTPVAGNTVVLAGARADGVPFELVSAAAASFELQFAEGPGAPAGRDVDVEADLAVWFSAVDLSAADVGTDGSIAVDHANNVDQLATFEAHFADALTSRVTP